MRAKTKDTGIITKLKICITEHSSAVFLLIALAALTASPWFAPMSFPQSSELKLLHSAVIGLCGLALQQIKSFNDLHEITQDAANNLLHETYPPTHWERLLCAKELWFTGLNLRRMVFPDHAQDLEEFVKRGGTLKVILLSRSDEAMLKYGARQDEGRTEELDIKRWSQTIDSTIDSLRALQRLAPSRVQIRETGYPMPFGFDAADIESPKGVIYVRFYPFFCGEGDKPILVLRGNRTQWFSFYKKQLQLQWDHYATDLAL